MLAKKIIERIKKENGISFHDFMEMALYYPSLGYYTSTGNKIGIKGDYYTSPGFSPLLGEMIALQLEEMWHMLGKKPFTIIEYGAGTGSLCEDILKKLSKNSEMYNDLQYCIIEKNNAIHEKQKHVLAEKIKWIDTIQDIAPVNGCVISNELVDNFPVHKVVMKDQLMEVFVNYNNGFFEELRPSHRALCEYTRSLNISLTRDFQTEINLDAVSWISEVATALQQGFVLTIDYGYSSAELYDASHNNGTLTCYFRHSLNDSFYTNIGAQDITAHVNFSALHYFGQQHGLQCCGFTSQLNFLHGLGLVNHIRMLEQNTNDTVHDKKRNSLIRTFLMDMGRKFKVLLQEKGFSRPPLLAGMRLARPSV